MEKDQNQKNYQSTKLKKNYPQLNSYLKYSGLAVQMFTVIGLCIWGGIELDKKYMDGSPVFVLALSFIGTFASIYLLYKSLPKQ